VYSVDPSLNVESAPYVYFREILVTAPICGQTATRDCRSTTRQYRWWWGTAAR